MRGNADDGSKGWETGGERGLVENKDAGEEEEEGRKRKERDSVSLIFSQTKRKFLINSSEFFRPLPCQLFSEYLKRSQRVFVELRRLLEF